MAVKYYFYFLLVPFLKYIKMNAIQNNKTMEIEEKSFDIKSHLELPKIKKICTNRDVLCRSNNSVVCTLKYFNKSSIYKMFKNACYLFLSNMCDNPGEEFYILSAGTCEDHFGSRRNGENKLETTTPIQSTKVETDTPVENKNKEATTSVENNEEVTTPVENNEEVTTPVENNNDEISTTVSNSNDEITSPVEMPNDEIITQVENNNEETTTIINDSNDVTTLVENNNNMNNSEDLILRHGAVTTSRPTEPITETETADGRPCPISCPKIYDPVCVNVNRGFGKYFKMFMFVNRCMYDLYYCKHPVEFDPPPNDDEYDDEPSLSVQPSRLGMSFCAASRYLQFARFSEVTSSMAHYGWLTGHYRYSHILEPHERLPGHG